MNGNKPHGTTKHSQPQTKNVPLNKNIKRPAFGEAGLYLHIPFCEEKCGYCDFYSQVSDEDTVENYTKSIIRAITTNPYVKTKIDTIYFGGGTPTVLSLSQIERVLTAARESFSLADGSEITMEANPEGITKEYLQGLKSLGVNRMSFGVQSGIDKELSALGRRHTSQQAQEVLELAGKIFTHLSADIMLGIPHQTSESLGETLVFFSTLPLDHISAYMLLLEPTVPLYESPLMNKAVGDDELADFYLQTVDALQEMGFAQYEISNFAKPKGQSRHNIKYWKSDSYLGIGPSAHSYMEGKRFAFSSDLAKFIQALDPFSHVVFLEEGGGWEEYLMLRLRLSEGVSLKETKERFSSWDENQFLLHALELTSAGLVEVSEDRVALTPKGFLLSNQVTAHLLYG